MNLFRRARRLIVQPSRDTPVTTVTTVTAVIRYCLPLSPPDHLSQPLSSNLCPQSPLAKHCYRGRPVTSSSPLSHCHHRTTITTATTVTNFQTFQNNVISIFDLFWLQYPQQINIKKFISKYAYLTGICVKLNLRGEGDKIKFSWGFQLSCESEG